MPLMDDYSRPPIVADLAIRSEPSDERCVLIERRICEKIDDYDNYMFSQEEDYAFKVFFDLSQEFERVDDFYRISVIIPKSFFNLESRLFILDEFNALLEVCSSKLLTPQGKKEQNSHTPPPALFEATTTLDDSLFIPIHGKAEHDDNSTFVPKGRIIGLFEISPSTGMTDHQRLFFEKYANRIGFALHNKAVEKKNSEHLRFIRSLVHDLGHNVVVPNMYYKLFFRRLGGKIHNLQNIDSMLKELLMEADRLSKPIPSREIRELEREFAYVYEGLEDQFAQIQAHYEHTSLFLETLLRQSHFEKGRYVLEARKCNFKTQVIEPQLKRYLPRFKGRGIEIDDQLGGMPDEEMEVVVDVGLISQVYANLFTNAVKYTRPITDGDGQRRKFIAYGREILKDYFGPGEDGVKLNVFSSGPNIPVEDQDQLFREGFRGSNAKDEYGTGHGLYFVTEVVKLHGGEVGYEPTAQGNNFYFILPK